MDLDKIIKKIRNSELPEKDVLKYSRILITEFAKAYHKEQLMLGGVVGQSEQFYCVSSDALVYGKPCKKWCGDEHCKSLCKQ